jgi:ADP-heptose:LPS heptosyltransferase
VILLGRNRQDRLSDAWGITFLADVSFVTKCANLVIANYHILLPISDALGRPTFGIFTAPDRQRCGPYPIHTTSHTVLLLAHIPDEGESVCKVANEMMGNV